VYELKGGSWVQAGFSRRVSRWRGGGIVPVWVNGLRCEDVPLEFVRDIGAAERWDWALGR